MPILISEQSQYGKEAWKWEHTTAEVHPSDSSIRGMRPVGFQPYPAMLYRCLQKNPYKFDEFVVHSADEQRNMESRGWIAGGQGEAVKAFEANQQALAIAAAERNYQDRNIGEKARAESDAAEQASSSHLGEIPRTPIKRRGRPAKLNPATS